ncbi:TIGR02450 family Trp-rich protein [Crenothrix sp.]|uniref:TIGR02450 family Trp-rich protein n=1 Tax=Crenothrix sp. TaxID=3100433 RepID=UPI00374D3255
MNKINPNKLLLSKWTAIAPKQKERHFIVTKLTRSENEEIMTCELEAVITKNVYETDWRELKNSSCWLMGWR